MAHSTEDINASSFKPDFETFPNPHDDILAELLGPLSFQAEDQGSKQEEEGRIFEPEAKKKVPPRTRELRDPFSGALTGELSLKDPEGEWSFFSDDNAKEEEMWEHYTRIQTIQSEIAALHIEMEGIGGKAGDSRGKGKKASQGLGDAHWGSARSAGPEVGADEEAQARDEEFARMADKFTGRKETVDKIMSKLGELSQALNAYHALEMPSFEFPSDDLGANTAQSSSKTTIPTTQSNLDVLNSSTSIPVLSSQRPPSTTIRSPLIPRAALSPTLPLDSWLGRGYAETEPYQPLQVPSPESSPTDVLDSSDKNENLS